MESEWELRVLGKTKDEWPGLMPYLENEGPTKEAVMEAYKALGIEEKEITTKNVLALYQEQGIDLHAIPYLSFHMFAQNNQEKE